MSEFEKLWRFITSRRAGVVQERNEMEYIYNLIKDSNAESYLEIGTAEGDSLYVFGNALQDNAQITCIDLCEPHTKTMRDEVIGILEGTTELSVWSIDVKIIAANSTHLYPVNQVANKIFDIVFIDGGHDYETVLSDCKNYAPLAKKYVFWHDIQLPDVKRAVDEYMAGKPYETFINSDQYGYAILKVS